MDEWEAVMDAEAANRLRDSDNLMERQRYWREYRGEVAPVLTWEEFDRLTAERDEARAASDQHEAKLRHYAHEWSKACAERDEARARAERAEAGMAAERRAGFIAGRDAAAKVADRREQKHRPDADKAIAAGNVEATAYSFTSADEAAMCALEIRNLEPEATDGQS